METITKIIYLAFALFAFAYFEFLPTAHAVVPPPDGGYPGGNTAEGDHALFSLTTGVFNTAVGWYSQWAVTFSGNFNTSVGAGALDLNTGEDNTAIGAAALLLNTAGSDNTATGFRALTSNDTGLANTANGAFALFHNNSGFNTAVGAFALELNTTGRSNTAVGVGALQINTDGQYNTAIGLSALNSNIGDNNIAVGFQAGLNLTAGNNNIDIGNEGVAAESNTIRIGEEAVQTTTYIAGISGQTAADGVAVYVNTDGKLGTRTSSSRFKDKITPMGDASEAILLLKPVTFRYKKKIDPAGISQFGLVAEDVEKVNPDLVVRDKEGKPHSVRYEMVNAMLLNEFLKEHQTVQELKKQVAELTAGLQKVSAQLELNKPAPQTVLNDQ